MNYLLFIVFCLDVIFTIYLIKKCKSQNRVLQTQNDELRRQNDELKAQIEFQDEVVLNAEIIE